MFARSARRVCRSAGLDSDWPLSAGQRISISAEISTAAGIGPPPPWRRVATTCSTRHTRPGFGTLTRHALYGLAEAFLASWLHARRLSPDALTIGSKWGYAYVGAWQLEAPVQEIKDLSLATLRRQIDESRTLLGDGLRLYQIHSATLDSGVLDDASILDELGRLRAEGLAIGLTVTGAEQGRVIHRALEVNAKRANLFQVVQATWNLLEPSAGPALMEAKAYGLGVIVKEAVANGRLTNRNSSERPSLLKRYADAHHTSSDVVAIAAALANPWVDVVLSGAVAVDQLTSNLRALDFAKTAYDWPSIAEAPEAYWRRRRALAWQ